MTGGDLKEIKLPRSSDNTHRSSLLKRQLDKFRAGHVSQIDEAIPLGAIWEYRAPRNRATALIESVTEGDAQSYPSQNNKQVFRPDRWFAGTARCDRRRHEQSIANWRSPVLATATDR
jgi:hypothetical protein